MTAVATHDLKPRMGQFLGQIAVVRQQQHPFCVFIQSTHGKQSLVGDRNKVHGARTSHRIAVGTQHSLGLIHKEITKTRHSKSLGIDSDILSVWIHGSRWIGDDF